ncbi:MAG: transposase family protein, partial [Lutibacter sp.]|nr:transposase family protein [Lutibacter sp.]
MFSEQLFDLLLNFGDSWKVDQVKVDFIKEEVDIFMIYIGTEAECPESFELCSIYDHRASRRWRHLDTMQFKTYINCEVPRVKSSKGVRTIKVPWADNFERHSYLFERLAI